VILLALSDFEAGFHHLAESSDTEADLQIYIDRYEKPYIVRILGVELAELFIANMQGTPAAPYTTLRDEFYEQDDCDKIWHSRGMKDFLKSAIFYHYITEAQAQHTQTGVTSQQAETSNVVGFENAHRYAERRFNESLPTVEAIQWKCETDAPDDFPTYNGTKIRANFYALF
jgi:hypothetical protein